MNVLKSLEFNRKCSSILLIDVEDQQNELLLHIGLFLLLTNHAVNIILFLLTGKTFRLEAKLLLYQVCIVNVFHNSHLPVFVFALNVRPSFCPITHCC